MGGSGDDEVAHGSYGQEILFLMSGLATGALVTYLISRFMKEVQYTVVLFFVGVAYAMCSRGEGLDNVFVNSIQIWSNINPHLILFIFLPALLFGDSLSMNFHHLKRTFLSSVLMAGPGAFISAGLIAVVGKYMLPEYNWSWNVCFIFGACLCSTDSVAVVSVLKDLKAQPSLTVFLVQSALMSEGTSLVLFNLFLNSLAKTKDETFMGVVNVTSYCFQIIFLSPLLGIGMGLITVVCLKFANKRVLESDTVVQIAVTICCAYLSFYVGEGVFYLSGVLCCVSSGVVIAALSPVLILEHKTFFDVWEMISWCSNTMIYLIAGLLLGSLSFTPTGYDVASILIVYVMIHVIRSLTTLIFFPFLRSIGYGLTIKEGIFNVFTGMKGTMVMALSLVFTEYARDKALEPKVSATEGDRIFFIVSGVSALSLLINGTFSAFTLKALGLVESTEHSEESEIMHFYARRCIQETVREKVKKLNDMRISSGHDSSVIERIESAAESANSPAATGRSNTVTWSTINDVAATPAEALKDDSDMLAKSIKRRSIAFFIDAPNETTESDGDKNTKKRSSIVIKNRTLTYETVDDEDETDSQYRGTGIQIIPDIVSTGSDAENASSSSESVVSNRLRRRVSVQYNADKRDFRKSLMPAKGFEESMRQTDTNQINPLLMKIVRKTFLEIVRSSYWKQIDNGTLPRSNNATSINLYSVDYSLDFCGEKLRDWEAIEKSLRVYRMPMVVNVVNIIDCIMSQFIDTPNYVDDMIEWHYCETLVYLLTSYIEAHEHAQSIIPESFAEHINRKNSNSSHHIQILEEEMILSESRKNVECAKAMLSNIDDNLIAFHVTRQTANIILRTQETEIQQLQRDGILSERDAEHLMEEVNREASKVQAASLNHIWRTRDSTSNVRNDDDDYIDKFHWRKLLPPREARIRLQNTPPRDIFE